MIFTFLNNEFLHNLEINLVCKMKNELFTLYPYQAPFLYDMTLVLKQVDLFVCCSK